MEKAWTVSERVAAYCNEVVEQVRQAECHVGELRDEIARLEMAGMYEAVPTEQWQDRNGKGDYLYMLFPYGQGGYTGPDGKRKLYVGCDPARIEAARQLASNRRRWEEVTRTEEALQRWLKSLLVSMNYDLSSRWRCWPRVKDLIGADNCRPGEGQVPQ